MTSWKYSTSIELNKEELPKQPVPVLHKTAQRYLRSVKPFLSDQEYSNTEKIVKDFVGDGGIGPVLQKKLMERYEKLDNWVPFETTSFMCYLPWAKDGYICCYNPRSSDILFACTTFKYSNESMLKKFTDILRETLHEMKELAL